MTYYKPFRSFLDYMNGRNQRYILRRFKKKSLTLSLGRFSQIIALEEAVKCPRQAARKAVAKHEGRTRPHGKRYQSVQIAHKALNKNTSFMADLDSNNETSLN